MRILINDSSSVLEFGHFHSRIPPAQLVDRSYSAYKKGRARFSSCFLVRAPLGREGRTNEETPEPVRRRCCRLSMNNPPTALVGFGTCAAVEMQAECMNDSDR